MMTKTATLLLLWTLTSLTGCIEKPDQKDYNKALSALERDNDIEAKGLLEGILRRSENSPLRDKAARQLVDLFSKNNAFEDLNKPLRYLSIHSSNQKSRIEAKQKMADNTYFNLRNYQDAIRHYSQLITLGHEVIGNHLMVVKSYFNLNQPQQSLYEADALLEKPVDAQTRFELMLLKANILFSDKNFKNAAKAYNKVLKTYPEQAKENHVLLNLAMSYEEEGHYKEALESLVTLKDDFHTPSFIEAKIAHLQSKMSYMPGARGYVK